MSRGKVDDLASAGVNKYLSVYSVCFDLVMI